MTVTDAMIEALRDLASEPLVVDDAGEVVSGTWINTNTRRALTKRKLVDQWPPGDSPRGAHSRRVKWVVSVFGTMILAAYDLGRAGGGQR